MSPDSLEYFCGYSCYGIKVVLEITVCSILAKDPRLQQSNILTTQLNKTILKDELGCDAVIIPGNGGNPVKCHRSFLMGNSLVFRAMFENDMEEAKKGEIEMPEMSEGGVRAFLAYLYYRDEEVPNAKCGIALELMIAGHKYDVQSLENDMTKKLLYMSRKWYETDLDVAVKLYLFARNVKGGDQLKKKAISVMRA